jgi:hypothetical protein
MSPNTAITLKPNYSVTPKIIPPSPGMRFLTAITVIALNALQARAEDAEKNGATTDVKPKPINETVAVLFGFIFAGIIVYLGGKAQNPGRNPAYPAAGPTYQSYSVSFGH